MSRREYDFVYLTNTPSFYKLRLCESIAREGASILLVLYGYGSEAVNTVLDDSAKWLFDWQFINCGDTNKRSKLRTFMALCALMRMVKARWVLFSGWMAPEYNLYAFLSARRKNVMICESSILDVDMSGLKGWLKQRIISRMSVALPSGQPHDRLFEVIGFKGDRFITGSVGIFNKPGRNPKPVHTPLRYLYVGRLIDVKNLRHLVDVFNASGRPLTIVGAGELEVELKGRASANITFKGFVDNNRLGEVYQSHDVFILPSYYEPWGLVVEEALYWGLPVIVSDRVGSSIDMVKDLGTGVIFKSDNAQSLSDALTEMEQNYSTFRLNVSKIDWDERDRNQVNAYLKLLRQ